MIHFLLLPNIKKEHNVTYLYKPDSNEPITLKEIGGKAYSLHKLHKSFNIPYWFAVKSQTHNLIRNNKLAKSLFLVELMHELSEFSDDQLWAVRSSACDEDGVTNSFAGQLETFLFVPTDQVSVRIEQVWGSIHSKHVAEYKKARNVHSSDTDTYPAVIVQKMVNAESAGVGFGMNPISMKKDEYIISSVFGLGNLLVSGNSDADTWIVNNEKVLNIVIADKRKKEVLDPVNKGTCLVDVEEPNKPSLTDEQVMHVKNLISQANHSNKQAQDIEWAIEDGELYLLQSRPITTVDKGKEILWDNSNIAESYGGITTPLTFSFAKKAYENVYRELCSTLNIPKSKLIKHDYEFRNMLGLIQGRVYYNMNSWYKTLALLPGFSISNTFMEQMMGVRESISDELYYEIQESVQQNKFTDSIGIIKTSLGLGKSLLFLDSTVKNFYKRLDSALSPRDLSKMSLNELVDYYNELEIKLLKQWDAPMVNDLFAMIFYGLLRKLGASWCQDTNESVQNALILTQGGIISAEPAKRMKNMAKKIRSLNLPEITFEEWVELVNTSTVRLDIENYIDQFGDRCLDELKLESIVLSDNPTLLYETLYEMSNNVEFFDRKEPVKEQIDIKKEVLSKLPFFKRHVFSWIIKMTRKTVRERENLRFERTKIFGRVRKIFLAIGAKLCEADVINEQRDIFYLEVNEVLSFVEGTSTLKNLRTLIEVRKGEFSQFHKTPAPAERFSTFGVVSLNNQYTNKTPEVIIEGDTQKGLGCCPGIVKGKVRIVRDPTNVKLEKGVILVAERTDPGWIMLFSSVSAILVEKGSLLSHAAIVARELNLPAVVSVPGLMNWLQDGDLVEMNGTTGTITKITE